MHQSQPEHIKNVFSSNNSESSSQTSHEENSHNEWEMKEKNQSQYLKQSLRELREKATHIKAQTKPKTTLNTQEFPGNISVSSEEEIKEEEGKESGAYERISEDTEEEVKEGDNQISYIHSSQDVKEIDSAQPA